MTFGSTVLRQLRDVMTNREPEGFRALSNLYWRTFVVTALLVLIAIFSYSMWGLLRVLNDLGADSGTSVPPPPALSRTALDAVVDGFEKRQQQFDLLKKNRGVTVSDPSR